MGKTRLFRFLLKNSCPRWQQYDPAEAGALHVTQRLAGSKGYAEGAACAGGGVDSAAADPQQSELMNHEEWQRLALGSNDLCMK
jgi:hypothetical protein